MIDLPVIAHKKSYTYTTQAFVLILRKILLNVKQIRYKKSRPRLRVENLVPIPQGGIGNEILINPPVSGVLHKNKTVQLEIVDPNGCIFFPDQRQKKILQFFDILLKNS